MTAGEVLETLSRLPHFQGLERELLERVAAISRLRALERGALIFSQGERCTAFFAVRRGRVRLFRSSADGREHVVHVMGPGQTFAEAAVFVFGVYPVSATAVEPATELVEVSGPGFLQLLESDPRLARKMMGSLCQRLVSLVQRVEELSIPSAAARLARYVLGCPSQAGAALEVVLPMAKKELAAHLAMTPETLSRQFARWRERGWIEMDGRTVAILDPGSLEALSQG